jgi:hypothetical protein
MGNWQGVQPASVYLVVGGLSRFEARPGRVVVLNLVSPFLFIVYRLFKTALPRSIINFAWSCSTTIAHIYPNDSMAQNHLDKRHGFLCNSLSLPSPARKKSGLSLLPPRQSYFT